MSHRIGPRPGVALLLALFFMACGERTPAAERPNFLLIVADDMGYADIPAFGGDVPTPNLDALAARGLRATSFYVNPTCSPTRSTMLTGVDNHQAGLGNMAEFLGPEQLGKPGYEGHLNARVVTVATLLRDAGYHTYMAGKWHLGEDSASWPAAQGFERDFTLLQGGGSNWSDMKYPNPAHPHLTFTRNGALVDSLPPDYYSSTAYADFLMQAIDEQRADGKPFFAYLSFQAVHSPFAARDEFLQRFDGWYREGYDSVRAARTARMKAMGIIPGDASPFPGLPTVPAWATLSPDQQTLSARRMAVYAAMLSEMDAEIGRVLQHLADLGELDNTVVFFLSDNGAEFIELSDLVGRAFSPAAKAWMEQNFDFRPEHWGQPGSVVDYGPAWAQASSGPLRLFKAYPTEGGIRSPLIVAGPGVAARGGTNGSFLDVSDLVPTMLEMAGATRPTARAGVPLAPLAGRSMVPVLSGAAPSVRGADDWRGWELFGNRALRQGDWKLLSLMPSAGGTGNWELYNVAIDPGEVHDQAAAEPARRDAMIRLWEQYAADNGVILTGDGPFAPPAKH